MELNRHSLFAKFLCWFRFDRIVSKYGLCFFMVKNGWNYYNTDICINKVNYFTGTLYAFDQVWVILNYNGGNNFLRIDKIGYGSARGTRVWSDLCNAKFLVCIKKINIRNIEEKKDKTEIVILLPSKKGSIENYTDMFKEMKEIQKGG